MGSTSGNYFSATDAERLQDFQEMLDDERVNAILCGRGGYGVGRIIDQISFKSFKRNQNGSLVSAILQSYTHISIQITRSPPCMPPMAAAFNDEGFKNEYVLSLKKALEGKKAKYTCEPHVFNHKGEAVGELVGGNLALLVNVTGTASQLKTKGRILFVEDVGEYLVQHRQDVLANEAQWTTQTNLQDCIIGGFTDMKDAGRPFGKNRGRDHS